MFHTIITLTYTIPNIYVFLRIWNLFINKGYRFYYSIVYIAFALIYPFGRILSESGYSIMAQLFRTVGNYILPFYLYLFLFILFLDFLLLSNLLFRLVQPPKLWSSRIKKIALGSVLTASILVVVAGVINFNSIRISRYQIDVPAKSSNIRHLKIAFAADFHLGEETSIHFVEKFAKEIRSINPDILLFGGDIVEGHNEGENLKEIETILNKIETRYGVFGVLGNHEHYSGHDKGSFFDKAGIKVLTDTSFILNNSFTLAGRNDSHFRSRKSLENLLASVSDSLPLILLDHRPTEIEQVSKTLVDVQLSGHTHNGQLFPINLITNKIYELSWGYKKIGNTHFFVTSGIQLWGPPVRTVGKSEILVVDVDFVDKE